MTVTAIVLCRDVIKLLRGCDARVVAGGAIDGIYAQVVESDTREAGEVVDIVTGGAVQCGR